MISGVSSRLFQPYTCPAPGPIRDEVPTSSPYLKLPEIPSRQYADLRNHPGFQAIKTQFLKDIDEMNNLARGFVGDIYKEAIRTFRNNIDEPPENIESGLFPIFEETRHQIHNIVARMKARSSGVPASPADSTPERDRITLALHICLNEIDHCPAGVQSRFCRAWQSLEAAPEQLDARLFLIRKTILEEFSHNFLSRVIRDGAISIQPGDEIHWVNALFNAECGQFGLDSIADPMATSQISKAVLTSFRRELPQALNEYTVLHTLAFDYYQRFCHFLDKKHLSHWHTERIPSGKLTSNYTDDLEQAIVTPLNQLCDVKEKEKAISLRTLIELDGDGYTFTRCREKIQGWLTRTIMQTPATLFTRVPVPPDRPQKYICTYGNLFFWIFETGYLSEPGVVCPFDAEVSKPLKLSDLSTIDVFSWPEPVQLALLNQAIEQTGVTTEDAQSMAAFLLGKGSGKALRKYPDNVQNAVASQLTEKMAASQTFADELAVRFCESFRGAIPRWVMKTPLLERLLVVQWISGEEVYNTTDNLSIWQLMTFSPSSLKTLLTPDKCQNLFQSALDQEQGGLMWRLLQTGHCDTMNNHANPQTRSVLMELCRLGIADGAAYLVSTLSNTDVNSKNANGHTALHYAAFYRHPECLGKLLTRDDIAINEKGIDGWTALHITAEHGHPECLGKLLARDNIAINEKNIDGWTALHLAARYNHAECLEKLLAMDGVALNATENHGYTALHFAAFAGYSECLQMLLQMELIRVNATSNHGSTPLMGAVVAGQIRSIELLLSHRDTDPNLTESNGYNACDLAHTKQYLDIATMLENDPRYKK